MASKKPIARKSTWDGEEVIYKIDWKNGYVIWEESFNMVPRKSKLYGAKSDRPYFKHDGQIEYLDDFIPVGRY